MSLPKRRDPDGDKRRALRFAARETERAETTERERNAMIKFAHEAGNSLREIEAATGIPFNTVKRIIDRQRAQA
jgi:hypothetical protein